jgi:hypothetical protein
MTFEEKRLLKNAKRREYYKTPKGKEAIKRRTKRHRERLRKLRELAKNHSVSEYHQLLRGM